MENISEGIPVRLAKVRQQHFGRRGKSRFARELGIRPSTYNHYETDRTAPPQVLVRAARITGTSLEWLLTGEGNMTVDVTRQPESAEDQLVVRLRRLLSRKPELRRSVTGFLELLEEMAGVLPDLKIPPPDEPWHPGELIPVVGSTAAGLAHFWAELDAAVEGPQADARLEKLLGRHSERASRPVELVASLPDAEHIRQVSLVQLSQPDDLGTVEFLRCPAVGAKYPTAVAWRIDGDSMSPRFRDGDLVVTCSSWPAVEGHPCVARQRGQIGVNCKIFHREGNDILLIPVNESATPQRLSQKDLLWAYRVLYSVRLAASP